MKIFDCILYNNEDLILDVRLNTLSDYVSRFVIVEANKDHQGKEKKLNFNIKNFKKFKDKIEYLVIDNLPKEVKSFKKNWESAHLRDQFQRNSLEKGYKDSVEEDLIMISDIDEIPDPKKISEFNKINRYGCFIQKNFQSKINILNTTEKNWSGTKICQKRFLKSPQWLRNIKTNKRSFWKFYKPKEPQLIMNGGWHFSYLKSPESISNKIKSFAHQEFNHEKFTNVKNIEKKIENYEDIFERAYKYKKIEINDDFPKYIVENKSKFRDWIV